jgi:hypothetical protein
MKYIILMLVLVGCASTPADRARDRVRDCMDDLIDKGTGAQEAYNVCHSLYLRNSMNQ